MDKITAIILETLEGVRDILADALREADYADRCRVDGDAGSEKRDQCVANCREEQREPMREAKKARLAAEFERVSKESLATVKDHPGVRLNGLLDAVGEAIVDLSAHPAGCDDWRFYEQLCMEVADRLDAARSATEKEKEAVPSP